jgi:hypothetical protein
MTTAAIALKAVLRLRPGSQVTVTGSEITEWRSPGDPPTQGEIDQAIAEIEAEEAAPKPDWRGFLQALRRTTVFAALRGQARMDVAANALATELRTALGEAALGLVDAATIQALLDELWPSLDATERGEILAGVEAFHIPLIEPAAD